MKPNMQAALYYARRRKAKQRYGNPPIALATFNPPNGQTSVLYSYEVEPLFTGGDIVSFTLIGTLPTGLNLNPTTGLIDGTPTIVQTLSDIYVTGTNADGSSTTNKADITIV